jgi:uncharacterized membrane protein
MNDVIDIEDDRQRSLKTVGNISYLLHTIVAVGAVLPGVQASIALLIVAFIIDMVKKDDAAGTWQESHFSWRIRTVLWAGGLYIVTIPLWLLLVLPGWIAWAAISIWFLYRVIRGWMNLNAGKAMPQ